MAKQRMHRSAFIKLVKERLPDLREAINKERQIFGFELMQLTKCAQRAIHDEDRERFEICVALAEQAYLEGGKSLKKMIDTMFMEPLEFVTPKRSHYWAWEMTPDCLKDLYVGRVPDKPKNSWKPARR